MKEQLAVQKLLLTRYEDIRSKNPQYSRRAFSKKLGLSAGAISELFNGQRKISVKLAERIAQRLALDPQERTELFAHFPSRVRRIKLKATDQVDPNYLQLSADQFRVIGDWYHFAILTLMRTKGFKSDVKWIANRLALSPIIVKTALERLKRLELIQEDRKGNLARSKTSYRTSDDIANSSVRRAHSQYLDRARNALDTVSVEKRDFTSVMLTLSPHQLPRAKEIIRKFQDELAAELESAPQSEAFQLCVQLFPLTQIESLGERS